MNCLHPRPTLRACGNTLLPTGLPALLAMLMAAALLTPAAAVDVPNRNPPAEEKAVRQAREAIGEQAWPRAVELLQTHVRAYPDDADAHNLLGYSLRQLGRFEPAQAAYERALAIDPDHQGAHEYLGQLMLTLGRRERTLHHLQTLERLCPRGCPAHDQLKRAYESAQPNGTRRYGR